MGRGQMCGMRFRPISARREFPLPIRVIRGGVFPPLSVSPGFQTPFYHSIHLCVATAPRGKIQAGNLHPCRCLPRTREKCPI